MPTALRRHVKAWGLVLGSGTSGQHQALWKLKACRPKALGRAAGGKKRGLTMPTKLTVVGVHPVEAADEPCHLIELLVEGADNGLNLGEATQEVKGKSRDDWQAPYDEQILEEGDGKHRYAFFFHYLDLKKPLQTPFGPVNIPPCTDAPKHLKKIKYEAP